MKRCLCLSLIAMFACLPLFADGAALYRSKCTPCHGADGTGNTPVGKSLHVKSLVSEEVQKLSDAELTKVIHDGRNKMPAFAGKMTDEEIASVVQFIRTFAAPHK
jgi:cytochrome c6